MFKFIVFYFYLTLKIKINFEKKNYENNKDKLYRFKKKGNEGSGFTSNII